MVVKCCEGLSTIAGGGVGAVFVVRKSQKPWRLAIVGLRGSGAWDIDPGVEVGAKGMTRLTRAACCRRLIGATGQKVRLDIYVELAAIRAASGQG